jgi:hypothetical protein
VTRRGSCGRGEEARPEGGVEAQKRSPKVAEPALSSRMHAHSSSGRSDADMFSREQMALSSHAFPRATLLLAPPLAARRAKEIRPVLRMGGACGEGKSLLHHNITGDGRGSG